LADLRPHGLDRRLLLLRLLLHTINLVHSK
jgi:hypothetical protein